MSHAGLFVEIRHCYSCFRSGSKRESGKACKRTIFFKTNHLRGECPLLSSDMHQGSKILFNIFNFIGSMTTWLKREIQELLKEILKINASNSNQVIEALPKRKVISEDKGKLESLINCVLSISTVGVLVQLLKDWSLESAPCMTAMRNSPQHSAVQHSPIPRGLHILHTAKL